MLDIFFVSLPTKNSHLLFHLLPVSCWIIFYFRWKNGRSFKRKQPREIIENLEGLGTQLLIRIKVLVGISFLFSNPYCLPKHVFLCWWLWMSYLSRKNFLRIWVVSHRFWKKLPEPCIKLVKWQISWDQCNKSHSFPLSVLLLITDDIIKCKHKHKHSKLFHCIVWTFYGVTCCEHKSTDKGKLYVIYFVQQTEISKQVNEWVSFCVAWWATALCMCTHR